MRLYDMIEDRSVASGDGCFLLGRSIDDVAHQQATFVGRRGMIDVAHQQATYVRRRGTSEFKLSPKYITRGVCIIKIAIHAVRPATPHVTRKAHRRSAELQCFKVFAEGNRGRNR